MNETIREDRLQVYEIGYLIAGVPDERATAEADAIHGIITKAGAAVISEESPRRERLAYTIRKKTVSGSYDSYDAAHFGWIKFEVGSDKIEAIKGAVEIVPAVLRMLLVSTVRENTYLGRRVTPVVAFMGKPLTAGAPSNALPAAVAIESVPSPAAGDTAKKAIPPAAPATPEEMDKSIDDMVKEA